MRRWTRFTRWYNWVVDYGCREGFWGGPEIRVCVERAGYDDIEDIVLHAHPRRDSCWMTWIRPFRDGSGRYSAAGSGELREVCHLLTLAGNDEEQWAEDLYYVETFISDKRRSNLKNIPGEFREFIQSCDPSVWNRWLHDVLLDDCLQVLRDVLL